MAAFCDACILASISDRAGRGARTLADVPPPSAAPATEAPCSRSAGQLLAEIIASSDIPLVLEWAGLARQRGLAAPPSLLPALLDIAAAHPRTRDVIEPILGARGLWLAAQREPWRTAVPSLALPNTAETWETAKRQERLLALAYFRRHDPTAARALVESTWSSLSAADRADAVHTLAEGLSMDDEAWLEACLDDRAASVQRAGVQLLAILPQSRLAQRMRERVAGCLSLQPGADKKWRSGVRKDTLTFTRPAACDAAMRRDGIAARFNASDANTRFGIDPDDAKAWREDEDWWLMQIIAAVPPGAGLSDPPPEPRDLILAAMAMREGYIALTGWRAAAVLHRDEAWAAALLETWCLPSAEIDAVEGLWSVLSPAQRDRLGPVILSTRGFKSRRVALALKFLDPRCPELSRACLEAIEHGTKRDYVDFEAMARGVHRALATEAMAVMQRIVADGGQYTSHVANRVLPLRVRLAEEFPS